MPVKAPERPDVDVSSDDFVSLEEKVYRTIELLKAAREAKANSEITIARLREQLEEREEESESLRFQLISLRKEREEVRGRVEKMLKQMDVLAEPVS